MDVITDHIVERLNQVAAEADPFPHIFVTELLPNDFYAELIRNRPAPDQYFDSGKRHHIEGVASRTHYPLVDERLGKWNSPGSELWRMLRDALCSHEVKQALFGALQAGLAYRFRIDPSEVRQLSGYPSPTIYRETQGYAIAPHPDTRKKIVTMQIALPDDDSQRDLGTALYRRSVTQLRVAPRGFAKVKQFPFLPNTAYAFVVLNGFGKKSWHGREALREDQGIRHSLLNIYGESPSEFPFGEPRSQESTTETIGALLPPSGRVGA